MMGEGTPVSDEGNEVTSDTSNSPEQEAGVDDETQMFSRITRPRVRYDVEVVTKLIVYSGMFYLFFVIAEFVLTGGIGIAWWSVEGNPMLFSYLGLAP